MSQLSRNRILPLQMRVSPAWRFLRTRAGRLRQGTPLSYGVCHGGPFYAIRFAKREMVGISYRYAETTKRRRGAVKREERRMDGD